MADKKKILFWPDVYKEQGHWLPTLAWADFLNSMSNSKNEKLYDISYMGIADCEEIVRKFQATFAASEDNRTFFYKTIFAKTYPYGYTNEIQTTPSNRWKPDHIWNLAFAGFDNDELKKFDLSDKTLIDSKDIREFFNSKKPDMVVSGYFTALETLILYYHREKSDFFKSLKNFVFSTTYLRHPKEDLATHALQNLMAFTEEEQNKLINIVLNHEKNPDLWNTFCKCSLDDFVAPLKTMFEFIPCAKKFDYTNYSKYHGNLVQYGEPCITRELDTIDDGSKIPWSYILEKPKLIYVTAGSQVLDYGDSALSLFLSMISAMQSSDMKDYHLILCVGSTLIQKHWDEYDNVTVCGWAPQRRILKAIAAKEDRSSCAVIHGGLATIKECIYYEVPFLVLPLGKDQMDNALRLEDCGIKNRFHIEYIKPKCLRYFINQVLQDYQSLLNLKKMSSEFRLAEKAHLSARKIAHLVENDNLNNFNEHDSAAKNWCSTYNAEYNALDV